MNKYLHRIFLTALVLVLGSANVAWADDWSTVWMADFSSAPTGMTYSVSNGSVDISTGVLFYHQGGGSGNRALTTSFTDNSFQVETKWQMEFDWGASSANTNSSNVAFATNSGTVFTIEWIKYAEAASITDASGNPLASELPIEGYNKSTMTNLSHFIITGDPESGITLTVTNGETTYVDNALVSSTFGYPATFSGSLGRAASHMALDNIVFKTPAIEGFVAAPTAVVTGVSGTSRSLTLSTMTAGATILWSETAPEGTDYSGWTTYSGSLTTAADPIYAVATDGTNYSELSTIETGAGSAITLNAPAIVVSALTANGDVFNPTLNATNSQANILLQPVATMNATFNGTEVTLPYTVTENGTLVVTVSADGYESASTELAVKANYVKGWTSTDYSTLTEENVTTVLGETWAKIEATGRWASWTNTKEPYTYFQLPGEGVFNVTIEENVRIRNVVVLNMGYGLSRNVSSTEAINFLNTTEGTIAEVKYYTGYGNEISEANTKFEYLYNAGAGMPSFGCNNGRVLMQVAYYEPEVEEPPFSADDYLVNPSFEFSADGVASSAQALTNDGTYYGWKLPNLGTQYVNISIGNSTECNGQTFGIPTPKDGDYYYYARHGWNSASTPDATMSTTMNGLPEGHYTLTLAYKGLDSWDNDHNSKGSYLKLVAVEGETELNGAQTETFEAVNGNSAGANKFTGDANWKDAKLEFDVTTAGDVTLNIVHHLIGGVRTDVVIDDLKLEFKSFLDAALEALTAELAAAEALKTEARTEGLADFEAAIQAASAVATTSQDAATISAAIEALKQAEQTFLTSNLPVAEGTYYIYNPLTKKFLSRGNAWGTSAVVDDYGVAINVTVTDLPAAKYTLSSFDNNLTYGDDAWMYDDCSGDRTRAYNINMVEDGITLTNTNNSQLVYVYLKEDGNKYRVAGNAIKDDNYTDDAQTVWQLLSKAERDQMVAAREAAQKTAAFEAAQIAEDADIETGEATELTFKNGHTWTQTVVRTQDNQPATNANGTEMWQATGSYAQTVEGLESGLYRVTIQAFYRNGSSDEDQARVATGYNTVLAYLDANGSKVQVKSWTSDKGEGNDPNGMAEAAAKFADGKYLSEGYAYVGEDGKLALTVNNPAHIGNGWFIVGNVKYAKVDKKAAKPGDITGDGNVTTGDAVAVVDFILEKSEPTEEQFKAADVNNDEVLTVSDAVGIVSIALGTWDGVLASGARQAYAFDYAANYLFVDGTDVALVSNTSFVGFQMDVTLSEGAQLNGVQLSQRTMGHEVVWNRVGQRTWRILVLSMGNDAISPAEGSLLHLDITGDQQVSVVSNEFTNAQLQGYHLQLGQPTGINGIYASDAATRIFNAAGQQRDQLRKGMNIVVDRNGKSVKMLSK